jgi:hypothetical protein
VLFRQWEALGFSPRGVFAWRKPYWPGKFKPFSAAESHSVPSTIQSDGFVLISGLRQSAVRQIAFSLHEIVAPAEAALKSPTAMGEKAVRVAEMQATPRRS